MGDGTIPSCRFFAKVASFFSSAKHRVTTNLGSPQASLIAALSKCSVAPISDSLSQNQFGEIACAKDRRTAVIHPADEWGWEGKDRGISDETKRKMDAMCPRTTLLSPFLPKEKSNPLFCEDWQNPCACFGTLVTAGVEYYYPSDQIPRGVGCVWRKRLYTGFY